MIYGTSQGKLPTIEQVQVGDTVYLGSYPLTDSQKHEPLEWQVLSKEGDRCLLITAYCIDWLCYHTGGSTSWAGCQLRDQLQEFAEEMFTEQERSLILTTAVKTPSNLLQSEEDQEDAEAIPDEGEASSDLLFLLSVYEAAQYFSEDSARRCPGTPYAVSKGCYNNGQQNGACWWLRNIGYQRSYAADVLPWGEICGSGDEVYEAGGVRPAMWVRFPAK